MGLIVFCYQTVLIFEEWLDGESPTTWVIPGIKLHIGFLYNDCPDLLGTMAIYSLSSGDCSTDIDVIKLDGSHKFW